MDCPGAYGCPFLRQEDDPGNPSAIGLFAIPEERIQGSFLENRKGGL
jgi:hypothetical protein